MDHPQDTTRDRGVLEPPHTPAQSYALLVAIFLIALGVLSLIFESSASTGSVPSPLSRSS